MQTPDREGASVESDARGAQVLDRVLVDRTISRIQAMADRRSASYMRRLGTLLLSEFFEDDPDMFHTCCRSHVSFRELSRRRDLPLSHTTLYHAVAIEIQCRELPDEIADLLSLTHHRILLPVKGRHTKVLLARRAIDEGISTRRFQELVRRTGGAGRGRAGRRPAPPVIAGIRQMQRGMMLAMSTPRLSSSSSSADVARVRASIEELESRMPEFRAFLQQIRADLRDVDCID